MRWCVHGLFLLCCWLICLLPGTQSACLLRTNRKTDLFPMQLECPPLLSCGCPVATHEGRTTCMGNLFVPLRLVLSDYILASNSKHSFAVSCFPLDLTNHCQLMFIHCRIIFGCEICKFNGNAHLSRNHFWQSFCARLRCTCSAPCSLIMTTSSYSNTETKPFKYEGSSL